MLHLHISEALDSNIIFINIKKLRFIYTCSFLLLYETLIFNLMFKYNKLKK